jgi:plasmid stabilization system protein ParE
MPPKKRRVELTRRAANEYLAGLRYLASEDLNAAFLVQRRVEAALERLSRYPSIARPGMVVGTRELPVGRTSYTLVYRVRLRSIQVLRVLHQRRKYP